MDLNRDNTVKLRNVIMDACLYKKKDMSFLASSTETVHLSVQILIVNRIFPQN